MNWYVDIELLDRHLQLDDLHLAASLVGKDPTLPSGRADQLLHRPDIDISQVHLLG